MGAPASSKIHHQPYFLPTIMQLLKRAANGNYSKLLEMTIEDYLELRKNLSPVRNAAKAFVVTKQLCAFYGIYVPTVTESPGEAAWVLRLRSNKPSYQVHPITANMSFSDLQLTAYMSGAVDYMLEINEAYGHAYKRFNELHTNKVVNRSTAEFLAEMWAVGFNQQQQKFEGL